MIFIVALFCCSSFIVGARSSDSLKTGAKGIAGIYLYGSGVEVDTLEVPAVLRYHDGIVFEMAEADGIEYRYFLEGLDSRWSEWSKRSYKEYTNLGQGRYRFRFNFRIDESKEITEGSFLFRVRAPWYLSVVARVTYPLLLLAIIFIMRRRTHLLFMERQKRLEELINERTEELQHEKEKSDNLLANMLPKGTAQEIMSKGKAAKTKYNFVTVLFSDIQGFTRIAEEMNPEILIDELDRFFFHFDSVAEMYRIEKIKTIGDAYMCAGGIPERNRTNPVEVVLAALEMQRYMKIMREDPANSAAKFWDIRIGIHTGTVIAGVVGHKKITYDIWGDTVNTASRMESSGEAGKINISGTTYEFVKEYFTCDYRGRMPVKYKGDLDMYFVTGIRPELRESDGSPNRRFFTKIEMIRIVDIEELVFASYSENASPDLFFHNPEYIRSVSLQSELLARGENLDDQEYIYLRLASVFIFFGYVFDYHKPLEASKKRAEEILKVYGFDDSTLEQVVKIVSSAFSPEQESPVARVLHDAVYDYFGRVDFLSMVDKLYREEMAYGKVTDPKAWFNDLAGQLTDNPYLTNTGKILQSVAREEQIKALRLFSGDKMGHR